MPRTFEVPDDLADFLDQWAPRMQKADAHTLLLHLIEQFRRQTGGPRRESLAPKSYVPEK
jgi:hypothetical protein